MTYLDWRRVDFGVRVSPFRWRLFAHRNFGRLTVKFGPLHFFLYWM